ncbi:MAG TPA: alpha/beta hydrolase, partial [Candidatus Limnocylindrales bacterium]
AAGAALAERRAGKITVAAITMGVLGVVAWSAISGYIGSDEVIVATTAWPHCDTPASKFGWAYEAINYDPADDAQLAARPGGLAACASQGAKAGSEVVTSDGIGIAGWYIPAGDGAAATAPTILISPGWKSNKTEVLKYAPFFHQQFNLVLLDLRNEGRSGGSVTTFGYNERQDVRAMIDWLERTKHPTWIGAMGNSMGAATVLGEAAGDQRVRALILDSMHARMLDTFTDGTANERNLPGLPTAWAVVGLSWLRSGVDIPSVDPVRTIGTVGDRPVLLIHGTNDILDTVDHAAKPNYEAAQAARVPVTIQYCAGGGHGKLVDHCPDQWQAWVDAFLAGIPELGSAAH